ncbi:MAG TPA: hypothetical protein VGQ00_04300 [Candidatus Norongarragalinales archaeon]|jgi:hypothetical protein|nr:hypothetical protein [Candidatus Norongarragalinales archaeon]
MKIEKLQVSGIVNNKGLLAITFEKKGKNFFKMLNGFLTHAGFLHTHLGVKAPPDKKESFGDPEKFVDRVVHLKHKDEHEVLVIAGASHVFLVFKPSEEYKKQLLGALKLYADFTPGHKKKGFVN